VGFVNGRSDGELLVAIRQGDRRAWAELVGRHGGRLWAIARAQGIERDQAADAVQTTWLSLIDNLDMIREPEAIGGWLATVAKHEAIRLSKRASKEPVRIDPALDEHADPVTPAPEAGLLLHERAVELRAAVARLGAPCRELLALLFSDAELSYAEISAVTGMPVGSIGPTRRRCLEHLRRSLEP